MAGKAGDDIAVAPGLLTMSVDGFDQPGFNLGMGDWFTPENEPPKKKKRLSLRRPRPLRDSNRFSKPVEWKKRREVLYRPRQSKALVGL